MSPLPFRKSRTGGRPLISTEDETEGLPGAPLVEDFYRPHPRKPVPSKLRKRFPAKTTTALATLAVLFVTFWDWLEGPRSFAASHVNVFEQGFYLLLPMSMLSHADLGHLLANLIGFIGFGYLLGSHFGIWAFPIMPAILGLATTLLTILANPPQVGLIGASGIVFSLVGTWVTLYFLFEKRHNWGTRLLRVTGFLLVLFVPHEYSESTSYLAHGIGFGLGIVGALILAPFVQTGPAGFAEPLALIRDYDRNHVEVPPAITAQQAPVWVYLPPSASFGHGSLQTPPAETCSQNCS